MSVRGEINRIRQEIELLKAANEHYQIYVIVVDNEGNESEPELLFEGKGL